jgi:hypothetical protein
MTTGLFSRFAELSAHYPPSSRLIRPRTPPPTAILQAGRPNDLLRRRSPGLQRKLKELEQRQAQLAADLAGAPAPLPRHPNLAEF